MYKKANGDILSATVKELMDMMDRKELLTDISTQRQFVYSIVPTTIIINDTEQAVNKSTSMMTFVLNDKGQLPGLIFWHVEGDSDASKNQPEGQFNLHDGLQRLSSIYRFYHPQLRDRNPVNVYINGALYKGYNTLPTEYKDLLDNYEFSITTCHGTSEQEENSFSKINSNVLPLTPYERLHGSYHGAFFDGFENFIADYQKTGMFRDKMTDVNRGDQAIFLLYMYLHRVDKNGKIISIINDTRAKQEAIAGSLLHGCRNDIFDATKYNFVDKINAYFKLTQLETLSGSDHAQLLRWQIVDYIFEKGYNFNTVLTYYEGSLVAKQQDINKWKMAEHITAIDNLFLETPFYCDYKRFFDKSTKVELYVNNGQTTCQECGKPFTMDELEVDHITAWSEGGPTVFANAQLLCKPCNAAKGGKNRI